MSFLLSGIVLELHGSVNTVVWVMTGLSVLALIRAYLYMPDNPVRARVPVDLVAAFLVVGGLVCVVLGLDERRGDRNTRSGWSDAPVHKYGGSPSRAISVP